VILRVFSFPIVTEEGFRTTLSMLIRFTGLTLAFFAVFRSIELNELMAALRWFGLPFSLSLLVIIAFRSIPSLGVTFRNVQDAHRLRAGPLPMRRGGRRRLAALLPVLTSVLIQAVKGMPVLAMVLESRGFGRSNPRTSHVRLKQGGALVADFLVAAGVACVFLGASLFPWG
jgi:energy-coupling factor transport system permease protein